ncbi:hypothetical protein ACFLVR_05515 [Chloroflexota bacterium]
MQRMQESGNIYQQIEKLLKEGLKDEAANEALIRKSRIEKLYSSMVNGKVLIIDDNSAVPAQLLQWCALKEYDVTVVCDGAEAKSLIKHGGFDAVIRSSEISSPQKRRR